MYISQVLAGSRHHVKLANLGRVSGQGEGIPIRGVPHPRTSSQGGVTTLGQATGEGEARELERTAWQVLRPASPTPSWSLPGRRAPPSEPWAVPSTLSTRGGAPTGQAPLGSRPQTKGCSAHHPLKESLPVLPAQSAATRRGQEGAALIPHSQGLQTLFLIPQPLAS